ARCCSLPLLLEWMSALRAWTARLPKTVITVIVIDGVSFVKNFCGSPDRAQGDSRQHARAVARDPRTADARAPRPPRVARLADVGRAVAGRQAVPAQCRRAARRVHDAGARSRVATDRRRRARGGTQSRG